MYFCYVDESGDSSALPNPYSPLQPALVLTGLALKQDSIRDLTADFLKLKTRWFPGRAASRFLDNILWEIKGADLRRDIALGSHDERRHALGFVHKALDLLAKYHAKLFARVWIKGIGVPFDGRAVYTFSVQDICATFQSLLAANNDNGIVIADFRTKHLNAMVSHSVFSQKYQSGGDSYGRILEMPTFGHSDNHAGIQLADLLASAILFPMAVYTYCTGYVLDPTHVRPGYSMMAKHFGPRIKALQYRYCTDRWHGGITVSDVLGKKSSAEIFRTSTTSPPGPAAGIPGATPASSGGTKTGP